MKKQTGRKAIVVLTDGEDRGSQETLNSAIESAQRSETVVYTIYYGGHEDHDTAGSTMAAGAGAIPAGAILGAVIPAEAIPEGVILAAVATPEAGHRRMVPTARKSCSGLRRRPGADTSRSRGRTA